MTKEMMALKGLVEKTSDSDLLREMIGFAAERLMAMEVGAVTGAFNAAATSPLKPSRNSAMIQFSACQPWQADENPDLSGNH